MSDQEWPGPDGGDGPQGPGQDAPWHGPWGAQGGQPPPGYGPAQPSPPGYGPGPQPGYGAPPPYGGPPPQYPGGPGHPPGPPYPPPQPGGRRGGNGLLIGLGVGGAAIGLIAVIVVAVVVIQFNRASPEPGGGTPTSSARPADNPVPVTKRTDGTVVMAKQGVTSPVLDIWEDFQCRFCKQFEDANSAAVKRLVADGEVKVVYHPITVFPAGGAKNDAHDNSVRALNAALAVPAGQWAGFHDKLYANQPAEDRSGGFPTSLLLKLGREAGITDPGFTTAVNGMKYQKQADAITKRALIKEKVTGAPTLRLNGENMQPTFDPNELTEAVKKAH